MYFDLRSDLHGSNDAHEDISCKEPVGSAKSFLQRLTPFYIIAVWRAMCRFLQTTEELLKQG